MGRNCGAYLYTVRNARMLEFGLHYSKPRRELPTSLLNQLSRCKSDAARRLILGVSKRSTMTLSQTHRFNTNTDNLKNSAGNYRKLIAELRQENREKEAETMAVAVLSLDDAISALEKISEA